MASRGLFRRALCLVVAGAAALVFASASTSPATAACAPPTLSVDPPSGPPGGPFEIAGEHYFKGCNDTSSSSTTQPAADSGIRIVFVQGSTATLIGTATAGGDGRIAGTVYVPKKATDGSATVRAEATNGQPTAPFAVAGAAVVSSTTSTTPRSTTTTTARTTTTTAGRATTTTAAPATTTTSTSDIGSTTSVTERLLAGPVTATTNDDGSRPEVVLAIAALLLAVASVCIFLLYRVRDGSIPE